MHHRTIPLLLLLCALLAPAASAPAQQAPATARATPLAQHGGTVLLSRWDGSAYRLATLRGSAITDVPGVSADDAPFDADLGPDAKGRTTIVYALDGDVFEVGLDGGTPRAVPGINTGRVEHHPSLWRGRLAFARGATTYVKDLSSSRAAVKLRGLPAKRCISVDRPACQPITNKSVQSLELQGTHVAQVWTYNVRGGGGHHQNELRLVGADGRSSLQVRFMNTGEGGQELLRPSFAGGHLAWYQTCNGDPSGCNLAGGAYRFRISDGRYQRAPDRTQLGGWAWDGRDAWRSVATEFNGCQVDSPRDGVACPITNDQPTWRAMKAPKPVR